MSMHVIWTQTGKEEYVKGLLEHSIGRDHHDLATGIYIPKRAKLFRSSGGVKEESRLLFPGYLFLETPDLEAFMEEFRHLYFKTFIHVLGKNRETLRNVSEEESRQILRLCGDDHFMGISKAIKEGTKVRFVEGPMVGLQAYVKKVEPKKCYAVLEMEMFGQKRNIAAAFETFAEDGETLIYGRGEKR